MARTSQAAKDRRKAKRVKKGGKPGNPGHFHGERAEFIEGIFPEFHTLKGQPRDVHKAFWLLVFARYWAIFHWLLPLNQDPPPRDPEADPAITGVRAASPPIEDEAVLRDKEYIIDITQKVRSIGSLLLTNALTCGIQRIKRHCYYLATVAHRKANPWESLLKCLRDAAVPEPAPHLRPPFQFYMQREADKIDAVFNEQWPSAGRDEKQRLAFRTTIARDLWSREDEVYREALDRERLQEHEKDLREYHAQQEALARPGSQESQAK